ncbi:MAG: FAD-dependent oxidoreductase [Candidatus Omnitrophota bacterium]
MEKRKIVILGGGISGLAAGYFLARTGHYQVTILEKADETGGVCGSFQYHGFTLDYGAHKLYSVIPDFMNDIKSLMGKDLIEVPKKHRIFLNGRLLDYPLKFSALLKTLNLMEVAKLGAGFAWQSVKNLFNHKEDRNYEDYVIRRFGRPAYQLVFEPMAEKIWGNPSTLHADIAKTRIPSSGAWELVLKLLHLKKESQETNANSFYYPREGFKGFPLALKNEILQNGGEIFTGAQITALTLKNGQINGVTGLVGGNEKTFSCDILISSIPIADLSALLGEHISDYRLNDIESLQLRHVVLVYLLLNRQKVFDDQWIFVPGRDCLFSRVFEPKNIFPGLGPAGQTVICCDFTTYPDDDTWKSSDEALSCRCLQDLVKMGFVSASEVRHCIVKRFENFYPRYDINYRSRLDRVLNSFGQFQNLVVTGRLGMYNYNNVDHCFDMGRCIAEGLEQGKQGRQIIDQLRARIRDYKIVD